jgi:hypothetical protein
MSCQIFTCGGKPSEGRIIGNDIARKLGIFWNFLRHSLSRCIALIEPPLFITFFSPSITSISLLACLSCLFIFCVRVVSKDEAWFLLGISFPCVTFLLFLCEMMGCFFIYVFRIFGLATIKYSLWFLPQSRKCSRCQLISLGFLCL